MNHRVSEEDYQILMPSADENQDFSDLMVETIDNNNKLPVEEYNTKGWRIRLFRDADCWRVLGECKPSLNYRPDISQVPSAIMLEFPNSVSVIWRASTKQEVQTLVQG